MTYKGYIGTVQYSDEDQILHGKIVNIDALVTFEGTTVKAIRKAFREAVDDYVDFCKRHGRAPEKPLSGRLTLRMSPELHKDLLVTAGKEGRSLNSVVRESVEQYVASRR